MTHVREVKCLSDVVINTIKCNSLVALPDKNMSDNFSDDIAERADEIEALSAIFEDSMAVNSDDNSVSEWKFPWQIVPSS